MVLLEDNKYFYDRLEKDSPRLFCDQVNVDFYCRGTGRTNFQLETTLDHFLRKPQLDHTESIMMLYQRNTYAPLQITLGLFKQLMTVLNVFYPFFDFIHGFGYKRSACDENLNGFECCYQTKGANCRERYELCYNIRYAARNGRRTNGSPWSIRHTAVYEQHDSISGLSRWIMVQPSDHLKERIAEYLDYDSSTTTKKTMNTNPRPSALHLAIFISAERDWREYINDLEKELKILDEKALFSRVGKVFPADYSVTFSETQALQRIRKKLLNIRTILEAALDILNSYKKHALNMQAVDKNSVDRSIIARLDATTGRFRNHRRSLLRLLEQSKGTSKLLFQILQYRSDETLHRTNELMSQLAISSNAETKAIACLNKTAQKEAHSMKVLTVVALLYLPASLVATIFSSNLVGVSHEADSQNRQKFIVVKQFWLYPVLSSLLMVLTIAPVLAWDKWYVKRGLGNSIA